MNLTLPISQCELLVKAGFTTQAHAAWYRITNDLRERLFNEFPYKKGATVALSEMEASYLFTIEGVTSEGPLCPAWTVLEVVAGIPVRLDLGASYARLGMWAAANKWIVGYIIPVRKEYSVGIADTLEEAVAEAALALLGGALDTIIERAMNAGVGSE